MKTFKAVAIWLCGGAAGAWITFAFVPQQYKGGVIVGAVMVLMGRLAWNILRNNG